MGRCLKQQEMGMEMAVSTRRKALITGAAGGMGRACARLFGATQDLVLTDAAAPGLERFTEELRAEGFTVLGAHAGDLANDSVLAAIIADMAGTGPLTLIHTAGLSPSLANADAIMKVNLVATVKLLDAIEPILRPGSAAVLIASSAGYLMPPIPDAHALMANPLTADFLTKINALIEGMSEGDAVKAAGISYSLSKQAVLTLTQRRALTWGPLGARITSISPGMILTPMGKKEVATPGGAMMQNAAPLGRPGVAADIALAAHYLASDQASFITGADLLVDGGSVAAFRQGAVSMG
jgi:NAD(P)-dependent dehydrogenase (short-subunit alcohol dehydrogenase family)